MLDSDKKMEVCTEMISSYDDKRKWRESILLFLNGQVSEQTVKMAKKLSAESVIIDDYYDDDNFGRTNFKRRNAKAKWASSHWV